MSESEIKGDASGWRFPSGTRKYNPYPLMEWSDTLTRKGQEHRPVPLPHGENGDIEWAITGLSVIYEIVS